MQVLVTIPTRMMWSMPRWRSCVSRSVPWKASNALCGTTTTSPSAGTKPGWNSAPQEPDAKIWCSCRALWLPDGLVPGAVIPRLRDHRGVQDRDACLPGRGNRARHVRYDSDLRHDILDRPPELAA